MAKGKIVEHLMQMRGKGKLSKPSLNIHVSMGSEYPGNDQFAREDLKRVKSEVKSMQEQLDNWDHMAISKRAMQSMKTELAVKKARLAELKARIGPRSSKSQAKQAKNASEEKYGGPESDY